MKKTIIILLAVMLMISSASLAEDLSSLSDEEFLELYKRVTEEMASRFISSRQEYPDIIGTAGDMDEDAGERVITMLYYSPEGGRYYHADRNCKTVHEQYLPLTGSFTYAELEDEPYKDLQPCGVCGAPLRPESQDRAVRFRDAADAAGEFVSVGVDLDYLTVVTEKNGKYIRTVTLPDDHARELYMAAMGAEDSGQAFETYRTYAWSLPVAYTEELTAKPKEQAELDALDGKTVGQLLEEGYSFYGIGGGENLPTTVTLSYGLFSYEFETDASFEQYHDGEGWDGMEEMKVKGGRLSGFSSLATNPDYLADGTYEPQAVPHVTPEEAAAADRVPPADYTFTGPAADPADEPASLSEAAFIAPNVIPAKGIEDFLGEWHCFSVVNEDGSEMNREEIPAEGIADDHPEFIITKDEIELYAASLDGSESVKYEFVPDDGSLRILNGSDEPPVLHLADNGMLILFVPAYDLSSGSTTAYLVRWEP